MPGFYYYGGFSSYLFLVLPALLFAVYAQAMVKRAYTQYSRMSTARGLTGADAAREILRRNGAYDVSVEHIAGQLSDHYDPRARVIRLSDAVYASSSVAAVGIAAHEAGHALQYQTGYAPIKFRSMIIPVTKFGSSLAIPLVLIGLFLYSYPLQVAGVVFFSAAVLFQLVTLPVEFNASRRALSVLEEGNYLTESELPAAKKMLSAAAMTYVAALAVSLAQFLRLLSLVNGRGRGSRW
jgi:Zn-dependent membrane protease YugP